MTEAQTAAPLRTHPLGILIGLVDGVRSAVLPAVAGVYGLREQLPFVGAGLLFVGLLLGIGGLASLLRWWRTTYTVGEDDIRLEQGVISRSARSVPFDRIQDVSLEQKLLARALGLVEVRFETGAGGKDELTLAYLPASEGARLREVVRERREEADQPGVPASAGSETVPPMFAMGPRRLALFGVFEFSLAAVAVLAGAAQQFDFLLPFDVWEADEWRTRFGSQSARIAGWGVAGQAAGIAIALIGLLAVGLATGLARTFAREWGFRLDRTSKGFRRRRGLFTRTDLVMPARRVQGLQLRTGPLRARWGWHALKFISLAQDASASSHVVAPFAKMKEIAPIAAAAGFALPGPGTPWRRPAGRAFVDGALLRMIPLLLIAIAALFSPEPLVALLPLLVMPLVALAQALRWRRARHALDEQQIYVRKGWLAPRTDVAAQVKLQSVEIVQGPLARRGGYAALNLGLAGGTLSLPALPLAEARHIRGLVLEKVAAVDFAKID